VLNRFLPKEMAERIRDIPSPFGHLR